MSDKYICSKAERNFLAKIGKLGGMAVSGEPKIRAGRLGGLRSGQVRRKKSVISTPNSQH